LPKLDFELSQDQSKAYETMRDWYKSAIEKVKPDYLTVGGFAGTGKTTLIRKFIDEKPFGTKIAVAAFTGKATHVLRKKGMHNATTLHRMMYSPECVDGECTFIRKSKEDFTENLIFVDEGSTVNLKLFDDILYFQKPTIFVGDMGQLEPIGDDPKLMANPDVQLTQIHRQAAESPIIDFSRRIRTGEEFDYCDGDLSIVPPGDPMDYAMDVDQVICGFNRTRYELNEQIRERKDMKGLLSVGDKMVCLNNNMLFGVFNGMIATVESIVDEFREYYICDMRTEDDSLIQSLSISKALIRKQVRPSDFRFEKKTTYWDYGYALTCHKCQGSEWDKVLVVHEVHESWSNKRWSYTAATRASSKLVYMI